MGLEFLDLFDEWAETYDRSVAGGDPEYQAVFYNYEQILDEVASHCTGNVLEFGSGTGNLTKKIFDAGFQITGIDPSQAMLKIAKEKFPSLHFLEGDFITFPTLPFSVDTIVSTYSFHHLTDSEKEIAIKQFAALLPEDGKVVFADTMFKTDEAKEKVVHEAKEKGFADLADDLEREYYPTIGVLKQLFIEYNFDIRFEQKNEFVWLLIAMKKGESAIVKKMNVESFNLDHTKVKAPYVRLVDVTEGVKGDRIYKYDIRFKQPNKEHMDMPSLHSIEHLMAENIRNHLDNVLDIGPMGCQTGFYLSIVNNGNYEELLDGLEKTLNDVLKATEVPACNEVQCGWAANHSLEGAKDIARDMLGKRDVWHEVF